jgi:hypothetical protein
MEEADKRLIQAERKKEIAILTTVNNKIYVIRRCNNRFPECAVNNMAWIIKNNRDKNIYIGADLLCQFNIFINVMNVTYFITENYYIC